MLKPDLGAMGAGDPDSDESGELASQSTVASGVATAIASGVLGTGVVSNDCSGNDP